MNNQESLLSVMFSIYPEYCRKIYSGEKKLEIRKNLVHKVDVPFTAYIYCVDDKNSEFWFRESNVPRRCGNGKIIGEFVVDRIIKDSPQCKPWRNYWKLYHDSGLTIDELFDYGCNTKDNMLYGYHISNLMLYNRFRNVSEFQRSNGTTLTRGPQGWCYVRRNEHD